MNEDLRSSVFGQNHSSVQLCSLPFQALLDTDTAGDRGLHVCIHALESGLVGWAPDCDCVFH